MPSSISIRPHPFNSPESASLVKDLESDLAAFYPDWDQLSKPNFYGNPRPATLSPDGSLPIPSQEKEITPFSDIIPSSDSPNTEMPGLLFFIAFDNSKPAGCVAVSLMVPHPSQPDFTPKRFPPELSPGTRYAEVKRMFIAHSHRGQGLSKTLLAFAEAYARDKLQTEVMVLEVGIRQKAAHALYRSLGYKERPMFGEYVGMDVDSGGDSVCMEKRLN